jgi:surfeit locus 1 family protein
MASRLLRLGRFQLRWSWPVVLAVLLAASGFVRLGLWQLERAAEKIGQQTAYSEAGAREATPLSQLPLAGLPWDQQQHQNRRVRLQGRYLEGRHLLLIYQTWEEQLGYEVLSAFQLDDGDIVLVSRGWSGQSDPARLVAGLDSLPGPRSVEGQLYVPGEREAARRDPGRNTDWPLIRRYVNTAELAPLFEAPLFPYVVRLAPGEPGLLVRHWPAAVAATDRHFSYALQWFAMALAVLAVSLLLASNLRELWHGRRPGKVPLG